jgi:GNAT superfamily N-acetyltransferase
MLSYQVESWGDVSLEMIPLFFAHYDEVEQDKVHMQFNPDFHTFNLMAQEDKIHVVTVRENGTVIGYHVSIVDKLLHHKHILAAISDFYWVHPKFRGGRTGLRLFQKVEETLRERGVQIIYEGTPVHINQGRLLEHLEYRPNEKRYTKWIGK